MGGAKRRMPDFKVTRYRIKTTEEQPGPQAPFSAVLLADLHNLSYGENNSHLLQEIRNVNPEIVFAAGDMLISTKEPQFDEAVSLMNELTRQYPVYYVNGNHESRLKAYPDKFGDQYEHYISTICSFGVHFLENSMEQLVIRKMPVNVWGLELPLDYYRRFGKEELTVPQLEEMLGKPDPPGYQILLAHHPCYFDTYASWGADLTLSGHLHGGMIRLPLLGGVISPQFTLFPKYDRGLYTQGESRMVVSAGLGSHSIPIRVNNPPELVILDFS